MSRRFAFALILISISFFFFLPKTILAEESRNIVVEKGEIINHDFFAAGESVTISGIVNGDVYAAGANVSVDGTINGDLFAGAGMVTVLGNVSDDVRVGGGNVLINGIIGRNLTVGGGSVIITSEADIGGSLLAFTGNLDVKGPIGKEANVFAGRALFSNRVGGDLKGAVENLILTSTAQVLGDLEYESEAEAEIDTKALITGETIRKLPEKREVKFEKAVPQLGSFASGFLKIKLYLKFFSFILSFLLGLLFVYLFPKRVQGINKILTSRPWRSLGIGFLTLILFPLGLLFLAISLVGIPFIFLVVPLFGFLLYFSIIFTSICLGNFILKRFEWKKSLNWALLIGLIVYSLLRMIPFLGPFFGFGFATAGLGAFLLDQKSLRGK